jgi:hypothetical protein
VYSSIAPVTVLGRSLAGGSNTDVAVAGVGSVPSNATSVQLSVTALDGTTTSSMYVYPTGATKPTSANVRWQTGETVTIPVTVAVGTGGKIHLNTVSGTVTVKVAVVGYFSPAADPGSAGYVSETDHKVIATSNTVVGSLEVPAGIYEVQGRLSLGLTSGGTSDDVACDLEDPAGDYSDSSYDSINQNIHQLTTTVVMIDLTAGGTYTMACDSSAGTAEAYGIDVVALKLSSASGDISGG